PPPPATTRPTAGAVPPAHPAGRVTGKVMPPSTLIRSLARRSPATGRLLIQLWLKLAYRPGRLPHWLLLQLSRDLNQRLVVPARLGNGMPIAVFWGDFVS